MQSSQLDPISNKMESTLSEAQVGMVVSASTNPSLHQYVIPNGPMELMESISGGSLSHSVMVSRMQMGQIDVKTSNFVQQQFQLPDNQFGGTGNMLRPVDRPPSQPLKRKALIGPLNSLSQQPSLQNKRPTQMEHRPWLQQASGINKRPLQIQNNASALTPMHSSGGNKRKVQVEPHPTKVGLQRSMTPKGQSPMMQPTSKIQNESTESVRSKMRESLTAALALVTQQEGISANDDKNNPTEVEKSQRQEMFLSPGGLEDNGVEKMDKSLGDVSVNNLETLRCNGREFQSNNVLSYVDISFGENFFIKDDLLQENGLSWVMDSEIEVSGGKDSRLVEEQKLGIGITNESLEVKPVQTPEGLAFKIEEGLFKLFSGVNKKYKEKGRSLLFNLKDRSNPELRERVMRGDISPERLCSMTAEELASKELSEWRMAKAEELAQMVVLPESEVDIRRLVRKTHKGEFQVEVEPDDNSSADVSAGATSFAQSDHTMNETDGVSPDEPETIKNEQNTSGQKKGADNKGDYTFTFASNDGSDFMQGLIVDDVLKDTESLPPIVSLDEFMESLNSEPPFDILAEDTRKLSPILEKNEPGMPDVDPVLNVSVHTLEDASDDNIEKNKISDEPHATVDIVSSSIGHADAKSGGEKTDVDSDENQASLRSGDGDGSMKSSDINAKSGAESPGSTVRIESLWEGILQLTLSTATSVIGTYMSGERTSVKDWPGILEIKGRVRLEAFEKFIQELPQSRSRAVMVLHLESKEGCPESERASLQEVADSYVVDERVGIADPGCGVEFYFCPPSGHILEMLRRILFKENNEALNAIHNGLIGVVVWRRTQLISISSPNNSHPHHKRSSKNKHFSSRRHQQHQHQRQDDDSNFKPNNISPKQILSPSFPIVVSNNHPPPEDDDYDVDDTEDVPPGFGPSFSRDDDDLPEFNFSGSVNPSGFSSQINPPPRPPFHQVSQMGSRPVDQMRELVHKYGQNVSNPATGNWQERKFSGVAVQPWNDDDDDIPEWQPQAPQPQTSSTRPVHRPGLPLPLPLPPPQPALRPHYMVNQQQRATQFAPHNQQVQAPLNVTQQGGSWWPRPPQPTTTNLGGQQFYGGPYGRMNPRQDPSNNRRF